MLRHGLCLLASCLALAANAGPACDALDRQPPVELRASDVDFDGRELILRADGSELIHVDADGKLFVERRPVAVPSSARQHLDAYVDGFRRLGDDAKAIGTEGAQLGARAVTGLVGALFTSTTLDDHERDLARAGERLAQRAEQICLIVADLQRTERELQHRIPAFPAFIAPVQTAL